MAFAIVCLLCFSFMLIECDLSIACSTILNNFCAFPYKTPPAIFVYRNKISAFAIILL